MTDIDGAWQTIRACAELHDVRIHDTRHSFALPPTDPLRNETTATAIGREESSGLPMLSCANAAPPVRALSLVSPTAR